MSDRYFAVSIDGTDWSKHIPRVGLSRSRTTLPNQASGSSTPRPGRRITSLRFTFRTSEDTEALVGTIPPDARAEVLLILAHEDDGHRSVAAYCMDATTLPPPWDTSVEIDGEDCFESDWYVEDISVCSYRFPSPSNGHDAQ